MEATITLIEEAGIGGVTMRELSDRLGVSRSAAYRHFEGKEDLLTQVACEGFVRLGDELGQVRKDWANAPSPKDRLQRMGQVYIRFAVNNSALYRLMFDRTDRQQVEKPELERAKTKAYDELVNVIETGQEQELFRDGPADDLALVAWAFVHGMVSLFLDGYAKIFFRDQDRFSSALVTMREGLIND